MIDMQVLFNSRILIMDDEEEITSYLERLLVKKGYQNINVLHDSTKCVDAYFRLKPDLLILDLNMPQVTGYDIMNQIHFKKKNVFHPVLVVTGNYDQESKLKALNFGARDFITKPFDMAEIFLRIQNMIELKMLTERLGDQNKILESKVEERTLELVDSQLEIVRRLGKAIGTRDKEISRHLDIVSRISYLIAGELGMEPVKKELLKNAVALHDIGKLAIPDSILLKPGPLNEEERRKIQEHAIRGAEMLS